jgi:hypothetical protein
LMLTRVRRSSRKDVMVCSEMRLAGDESIENGRREPSA